MTHFRVDILIPTRYNSGEEVPFEELEKTYEELYDLFGGVSTAGSSVLGSWLSPQQKRYNDESIIFTVVVESGDRMTITNVPKIKKLILYKPKLKERFRQEDIYMVATRCTWL